MARKEIIDLINKEIEQGSTRDQVVSNLIFAGFSYQEIQGALNEMGHRGELPQDFLAEGRRIRREEVGGPKVKKIEEETVQAEEGPSAGEILSKYKKIFFSVIIGLVIVIGGAFAGYYFYSTSTSVVMSRMLSNISGAHSGSFNIRANVDVNKNNAVGDEVINDLFSEQAILESKGTFDTFSGPAVKFSLEISAKNGYDANLPSGYDVNLPVQPFWSVGAINLDGSSLYFKLNNLATTTEQNRTLVSQLMPTWVLLDTTTSAPLYSVAPKKILDRLAGYQHALSSNLSRVMGLLSDRELIQSVVSLGSQNIENYSFYHYQITFNADKASAAVSEFYSAVGINDSGWLSNLVKDPWEIWIEKSTLLPYQISIKNDSRDSSLLFDPRSITIILTGLNASYPISPPAQYSSLARILQIIQNSNQ